jgi:hypothetical protein
MPRLRRSSPTKSVRCDRSSLPKAMRKMSLVERKSLDAPDLL